MKNIAIITGASSGMGRVFAETVDHNIQVDEIWAIARREDRLREISSQTPVVPFPLDLSDRTSADKLRAKLEEEKPNVALLVNASGYGKFDATWNIPLEDSYNMMDLNCGAVMMLCQTCLPYMSEGSKILNIASVAAFQPIPYINVYAATKSFVLHYSRALNRELKQRGISVTALCPFWTKTEFFDRAVNTDKDAVVKKYQAMYEAVDVVQRGWNVLSKGRDYVTYGFTSKFNHTLAKLLPHSFVMSYWQNQQGLK